MRKNLPPIPNQPCGRNNLGRSPPTILIRTHFCNTLSRSPQHYAHRGPGPEAYLVGYHARQSPLFYRPLECVIGQSRQEFLNSDGGI
jgi:hypothetical protein